MASAGPIVHHWPPSGPFHGMMPPTTPSGALWVSVMIRPGSELLAVAVVAMPVHDAKKWMSCEIHLTVPRVRAIGAPMSIVSIVASSSPCWISKSLMRSISCWRSSGFQRLHSPSKAARAAATARSTSAAVPRAMRASTLPSAGLMASISSPDWDATHFPPISRRFDPFRKAGRPAGLARVLFMGAKGVGQW